MDLKGCLKDSFVDWADFYKPFSPRPLGDLPVWLSYDPADSGDAAALVVGTLLCLRVIDLLD